MKRTIKQLLSALLAIVMMFGCLLPLASETATARFLQDSQESLSLECTTHGEGSLNNNVSIDVNIECFEHDTRKTGVALCSTSSSNSSKAAFISASMAVCSKHATYKWVEIKAATCSSAGIEAYTCPICKFAYPNRPTRPIDKKEHKYTWKTTVSATCTKNGSRVNSCTLCGNVKSRQTIYSRGHSWGNWITEKNPSCTTKGSRYHVCSVCKTKDSEAIDIVKHDQKGTVKTVQPSCTKEGYKVATCSMCGSEQGNKTTLSKTDHKWSLTSTIDATCTKAGAKNYKCTVCTQTKSDEIPKKDHICVWQTTKKATCTEKGEQVLICSCGYKSKTEPIDKIDHVCKWQETRKATCAKAGLAEFICINCGTSTNWNSIEYKGDHTWNRSKATCTEDKKCTVCGTIDEPKKDHSCTWQIVISPSETDDGKEAYICTECKTTIQERKLPSYTVNIYSPVSAGEMSGGGSLSFVNSIRKVYNGSIVLPAVKNIDGYKFLGYASSATDSVVTYPAGAVYSANENLSLYEIYEPEIHIVGFSGYGAPIGENVKHGNGITMPEPTAQRDDYTFVGWTTNPASNLWNDKYCYKAGQKYTPVLNDIIFYSLWEPNGYVIKFYPNGGIGYIPDQIVYPGEALTIPDTIPTREGYVFRGWSTSLDYVYKGDYYTNYDEETHKVKNLYTLEMRPIFNTNTSLYAVWEKHDFVRHEPEFSGNRCKVEYICSICDEHDVSRETEYMHIWTFDSVAVSCDDCSAKYVCSRCHTIKYESDKKFEHRYIVEDKNYKVSVICARCDCAPEKKVGFYAFRQYWKPNLSWGSSSDSEKKVAIALWLRYYMNYSIEAADSAVNYYLSFSPAQLGLIQNFSMQDLVSFASGMASFSGLGLEVQLALKVPILFFVIHDCCKGGTIDPLVDFGGGLGISLLFEAASGISDPVGAASDCEGAVRKLLHNTMIMIRQHLAPQIHEPWPIYFSESIAGINRTDLLKYQNFVLARFLVKTHCNENLLNKYQSGEVTLTPAKVDIPPYLAGNYSAKDKLELQLYLGKYKQITSHPVDLCNTVEAEWYFNAEFVADRVYAEAFEIPPASKVTYDNIIEFLMISNNIEQ